MGSAINTLAFPAPHLGKAFYQDELLRRPDLVFLKTDEDESIPACHVRAQRSSFGFLSTPPATILYSHGNAEDIGLHLDYIDALAEYTGADVFSYEYVGYSLSRLAGQTPSEAGCIRSIDAAWRYLVDEQKIHPRRIVIFGRSIGSGPSVDLASRSQVQDTEFSPLDAAGVILQSPLESGACVVLGGTAATLGYYLDIFRNYEKIGNIKAPVAIMHGTDDEVVPFSNGQAGPAPETKARSKQPREFRVSIFNMLELDRCTRHGLAELGELCHRPPQISVQSWPAQLPRMWSSCWRRRIALHAAHSPSRVVRPWLWAALVWSPWASWHVVAPADCAASRVHSSCWKPTPTIAMRLPLTTAVPRGWLEVRGPSS
ncbi:Abhd17a [Symbiodinium natans]|uniref:Abhd17a protein n=1 Tax=Symbiodinium natans TaxID=878477 RepID=A0A812UFW2_9DINO|nr:Abhd17a [Symbiodinium natans]